MSEQAACSVARRVYGEVEDGRETRRGGQKRLCICMSFTVFVGIYHGRLAKRLGITVTKLEDG